MRRRLFTFCSIVSLLLCVAVCVLWVRSEMGTEWFTANRTTASGTWTDFSVLSMNGGVMLRRLAEKGANPPTALKLSHSFNDRLERSWSYPYQGGIGTLGFQFHLSSSDYLLIVLPYWALTLVLLPLPTIWLSKVAKHEYIRRRQARVRGFDVLHSSGAAQSSGSDSEH